MVACLPLNAAADPHSFAAGSLIVPMDNYYQGIADGGALEAYGMVFYLLDYKRQDCVDACIGETDCVDACGITVYWVINEDKTAIDGVDLQIEATTDALNELGASAVVMLNDKTGGVTGAATDLTFSAANGDSANKISYRGGLFIIDFNDLHRAADAGDQDDPAKDDLAAVYTLINAGTWSAVDVHVAQTSFSAPVHRKMKGIPPKIALMNDDEDRDGGNAAILESYLRLAGICDSSYDVLTPYDIAGIAPDGSSFVSKLFSQKYDFLWAPHWTGGDYEGQDRDNNGTDDVDDIMVQIQNFAKNGKAILAECASIEVFEHNANGRFLTDKGFGHNEGTNDDDRVIYHDPTAPYAQIGDDPIGYEPEGGHLHNWRPYQDGDDYNFDARPDDVTPGDSTYNATVTRFTVDDTDNDDSVTAADWDYYVGGYAYGDSNYGYVVYLGGHKYAECDGASDVDPNPNIHLIDFKFDKAVSVEIFTLVVEYEQGGTAQAPVTVSFTAADIGTLKTVTDLEIDFTTAALSGDVKTILDVGFANKTNSELSVTRITLSWSLGNSSQKFKELIDTENDTWHWWTKQVSPIVMPITEDFTISGVPSVFNAGCTSNDDCEYKNLAGVRYVLNTLFNIKYTVKSNEYVRAPPIISHPYLYQGTFEYPSNYGHFRRYDVTGQVAAGDLPQADWDTGAHRSYGKITDAQTDNSDGRKIYTAQIDGNGNWQPIDFDAQAASLANIRALLNVTPNDNDDEDEKRVINRLRGQEWNYETATYDELGYKLGGIMHSAPVIVKGGGGTRFDREEMAYVGDIYGMLHAISTPLGKEKWAYIPSNLLGKLQNVRGDPNAVQDFAAVDASPTAVDIYYDHDADSNTPDEWRTILVAPQGFGGTGLFALDVTNPTDGNWKVLWETTVLPGDTSPATPGGGMGYAYRASLDKVKWPDEIEVDDANGNGISNEVLSYKPRWMVFVATSYAEYALGKGGIHVFAFDLQTGDRVWGFSAENATSDNDIPGAVTPFDIDEDDFVDRVYVGDVNGRMWELNAIDGSNPYGTYSDTSDPIDIVEYQVPLFSAGVGNPISVSPAIIMKNGHVILIFGTGGADWASASQAYNIYAVDATAAHTVFSNATQTEKNTIYETHQAASGATWTLPLAVGEKVWSTPTVAAGQIWVVSSSGFMEGSDPGSDIGGSSKLRQIDLDGSIVGTPFIFNKKVRGSLYVANGHLYMTTFDNEIIQLGDGDFATGVGNRVVLKSWLHH
jgi:hypothetical protein